MELCNHLYTVGVGLEYYHIEKPLVAGDIVAINDSNQIIKNGEICGCIGKQDKYYQKMTEIFGILTRDKLIVADPKYPVVFIKGDGVHSLRSQGEVIGTVIYNDSSNAIIDIGEYAIDPTWKPATASRTIEVDLKSRKEEKNMENVFSKLGFGKCSTDRFSLSLNGIAVRQKDSNKYVVYNQENNQFVDVSDALLGIKDGLFILPTVEVKTGDTIIHEDKAYFITDVIDKTIKAVSYEDCTQTELIPKTNMFGLKYFNKVYSMFGDNFAVSGEMFKNPMMLMAMMNGEDKDMSKLFLLNAMSNGNMNSNPMLMALMLKGDKNSDLSTLAMLSMMNGNNPFTPKTTKAVREDIKK